MEKFLLVGSFLIQDKGTKILHCEYLAISSSVKHTEKCQLNSLTPYRKVNSNKLLKISPADQLNSTLRKLVSLSEGL